MPRIAKPLTDTQIKNAKPKDIQYSLFDGDNLILRVRPNGKKVWIYNYIRPYIKKRTNITIGLYPDEVTLKQAREKRRKYIELLGNDIDPQDYEKEQKQQQLDANLHTLESVSMRWLDTKTNSITDDHANKIWRSLELHIFPTLGKVPISKLSAPKTIDLLTPIANSGSLETVRRLCQRINEVMTYAINTGLINNNPLFGIRNAFRTPVKKHLPTIKPDEFPDFLKSLYRANVSFTTRCLLEWQLHTIVRPGEAAGTRWEEIDFENKMWTIPNHRMKRNIDHIVPLTKQAISILDEMNKISVNREHVFPSVRSPRTHMNPSTANMAIKRMGYHGKLVAHGLRALASTILNENGHDYDVIESALSHLDKDEVRRAYNRADYVERRRDLMNWWSDYIAKIQLHTLTN